MTNDRHRLYEKALDVSLDTCIADVGHLGLDKVPDQCGRHAHAGDSVRSLRLDMAIPIR